MYRHEIAFRADVPEAVLQGLTSRADRAFNNRAGQVFNSGKTPRRLVYEGGEREYGCLNLAMLALWKDKEFLSCVAAWHWTDEEEPEESCDVLEEMAIPVWSARRVQG